MSRLMGAKKYRDTQTGHAWIEFRPAPENPEDIPAEDYLMECVWLGKNLLLVDSHGAASVSDWNNWDPEECGVRWRVWDEKPGPNDRTVPWA